MRAGWPVVPFARFRRSVVRPGYRFNIFLRPRFAAAIASNPISRLASASTTHASTFAPVRGSVFAPLALAPLPPAPPAPAAVVGVGVGGVEVEVVVGGVVGFGAPRAPNAKNVVPAGLQPNVAVTT